MAYGYGYNCLIRTNQFGQNHVMSNPQLDYLQKTDTPQKIQTLLHNSNGLSEKTSLVGLSRAQLAEIIELLGIPQNQVRMRVSQLWHWLYVRGVSDFNQMGNISKKLRELLAANFSISHPSIVSQQTSQDGTRKWLLRYPARGAGKPVEVETVYIPEDGRGTLCVSSQVGCTLTCTFCHTGTQRLVRNLTAGEIVSQLLLAREQLGDFPLGDTPIGAIVPKQGRLISNVVLMGMGEPLYNFDNVKQAIAIFSDGEGLSLSKRRVTLSTSGVVPEIERAGAEIGCRLAISLHAVRDDLRDILVPINKKWNISSLLEACRKYPGVSNAKRITFEYVMLKDVNDSVAEAKELVRLLKGIPAKINLIPFNPWPGAIHECSDWSQIERFANIVNQAGYASPIRTPRGRDIFAACGQLKSESQRIRASDQKKLELEASI